ncbi:MAG TPA: efflux transporter outer membrane subunit [Alphaproteobacteria bacterium]|nr:efflux transporter outer membrane subunit [Alphaproteobacteria bacterium]
MTRFSALLSASMLALLAGCAVGPNYHTPAAPNTNSYGEKPTPAETSSADHPHGAAQKFANGADVQAEWWTLFHSEPLNKMITEALAANPDLAAAQAALHVAQENTAAGEGILFPTVVGNFSTTRQKTSGAAAGGQFPGTLYTLHNASVNVTYGLDLWGASRREVEELSAQEDYQRFQLEAAYLTLTGNIVTAAIQEASLRGQIEATKTIVEDEEKQLQTVQTQFDLGAVNKAAVLSQQANLQQTRATLPGLESRLEQTRHLLSVLTGKPPSDAPAATFDFASLQLPDSLPVTIPSKLVEQRPDIRAADSELHAASASIGVAEANRLPQITLSAGMGTEAISLDKLFTPGSGIWSAGFGVAQTIFDGGTLAHQQGAAEASYDQAAALYKKTVLGAFQDVADTLRALEADADTLKAEVIAEQSASENLAITQEQYKDGAISYINLLSAEQLEQQAKLALVQAEAQRYADTAALFQSLGGGWWNRTKDQTDKILDENGRKSSGLGFIFP